MTLLAVIVASFFAAAVNAIAGGGTFITFPVLTGLAGLSEKVANMTSTVGLWPGTASSVAAGRAEFVRLPRGMLAFYSAISLVGGTLGAVLLLKTSTRSFSLVIPWLLAFATGIFAFSKPIARWAGRKHGDRSLKWTLLVGVIQLAVAVYGGYFGAGIGVLTLAGLSFAGLDDIHQMNALKVLLSTLINAVASVLFIWGSFQGVTVDEQINWPIALAMATASVVGGFLGMAFARKVKQDQLRAIVLGVGVLLTSYYFAKNYRLFG